MEETTNATRIAELNDAYRKEGTWLYTKGIQSSITDQSKLARLIREFSDFNEDNDPWSEHDFGSLMCEGQKIFWKIDYYDAMLQAWCDPVSPGCRRVMTVMLAEEY